MLSFLEEKHFDGESHAICGCCQQNPFRFLHKSLKCDILSSLYWLILLTMWLSLHCFGTLFILITHNHLNWIYILTIWPSCFSWSTSHFIFQKKTIPYYQDQSEWLLHAWVFTCKEGRMEQHTGVVKFPVAWILYFLSFWVYSERNLEKVCERECTWKYLR